MRVWKHLVSRVNAVFALSLALAAGPLQPIASEPAEAAARTISITADCTGSSKVTAGLTAKRGDTLQVTSSSCTAWSINGAVDLSNVFTNSGAQFSSNQLSLEIKTDSISSLENPDPSNQTHFDLRFTGGGLVHIFELHIVDSVIDCNTVFDGGTATQETFRLKRGDKLYVGSDTSGGAIVCDKWFLNAAGSLNAPNPSPYFELSSSTPHDQLISGSPNIYEQEGFFLLQIKSDAPAIEMRASFFNDAAGKGKRLAIIIEVPKAVTFNANDGSGSSSTQSSETPTTLTPNSFTRTNYSFAGWNTAADGSGTSYADGANYDFSADLTLFAQWAPQDLGTPTVELTYPAQTTVPNLSVAVQGLNKGGSTGAATYSIVPYGGTDAATGCSVDASGTVTITGVGVQDTGKCVVQVDIAADLFYDPGSDQADVVFAKSNATITLDDSADALKIRAVDGTVRNATLTGPTNGVYSVEIKLGETVKIPFDSPNSQKVGYTSKTNCPSVIGWDQDPKVMFPFTGTTSYYYVQGKRTGACSESPYALTLPAGLYSARFSPGIEITVVKGDQPTIFVTGPSTAKFGETINLSARGGAGTGTRTFSVSGTGCTITNIPFVFREVTYGAFNVAALTKSGAGTCDVIVNKAGDNSYNNGVDSAVHTVSFGMGDQELVFTSAAPESPEAGGTYTPTATATSGLAATFAATGTCTLASGVVTFDSVGDCTITASQAGNSDYNAATDITQVIKIGQRNQNITFNAITDKEFGDPAFKISASSSESALTVALTSADNTKCTVDANGIVVLVAAGTCTIHADQAGTQDVAAASRVTRSFEIFPAGSSAPFITSVSRGLGSLTATLIPPSYTGGATITHYEVQAYNNAGDIVGFNNYCVVAALQKCTVEGLEEGVSYTLRARAHHDGGAGSLSPASAAFAPVGNPDAVRELTAVAGDTVLDLTWLKPLDLGGATFARYELFIKLSTDGSFPGTPSHTIADFNTVSYQFTGRTNGASYDVKIVTITDVDTTEVVSNSALVSQVPYTTPNAVRNLTAVEMGDDLFITWQHPDFDGGRSIDNYDVDVNSGALGCSSITALYCVISKGEVTSFAVGTTANNIAGASPLATTTFALPTPPVQSPPSNNGSGGGAPFIPAPGPTQVLEPVLEDQLPEVIGGQSTVVELKGQNLDLVTAIMLGTRELRFELVSTELLRVILPAGLTGTLKLELLHLGGKLEQQVVTKLPVRDRVNAGTFNGVVALYALGFEGQRFSAKVGKDWVIVPSLTGEYVRIVERVGVGYPIKVRIFIDRKLIRTIDLVTR